MAIFATSMNAFALGLIIILFITLCLCALLFLRNRQKHATLQIVRRDSSNLRHEIGNITGWEADGRLPDDWAEILNEKHSANLMSARNDEQRCAVPLFLVAYKSLESINPPYYASNDDQESFDYAHQRLLELLENAANDEVELEAALVNGEFDRLFCLWRRLEAYFYDKPETFAYGIAANAALKALKERSIDLIIPHPLMMTSRKNRVLTNNDNENLRQIPRIRERAQSAVPLLNILQANDEVVVDCQRPGILGPNAHVTPRLLILDKSW